MKKNILLLFLSLILCLPAFSQEKKVSNDDLIQFSGVLIGRDSLFPVPYATILVKNTARGTTSDYYGFFSLVVKKGDTLVFSSIGYRSEEFIISDTLSGQHYSLIETLARDTVELPTVNIYPWPTYSQFKEAFLSMNVPDDDLERARKNLDPELMETRVENMPMTASMNFKWQNQQRYNQVYYAGQSRINNLSNLLNPIAWAKFIEAWKNGEFKRDE